MKYIAVFDIPDDYGIGCAIAKIAVKGKDRYEDKDFETAYARTEPLLSKHEEVFERFNIVTRIMQDL